MLAGPMRKQLNKVFPDHWSFMMGEIALYSFVILLLTGVVVGIRAVFVVALVACRSRSESPTIGTLARSTP